jgi:thiol-disulfide isomerase/thioredoxin
MVRKYILILFSCLFISENLQAQINWLNSLDAARLVANKTNKLIVMDFWAVWCQPCTTMDMRLWHDAEMQEISKNFVGVKINVDFDKNTTSLFNVSSIPRVLIVTAGGDIIWDKLGFDYAESFLPVFRAIPGNIGELNRKSMILAGNKKDPQANYSAGIEFQRLGKDIKNNELKYSFLNFSDISLAKAQKLCRDPVLAEEIELHSILNDVYYNRPQKALKMIEKMDPNPQNKDLAELRHFILAKSYRMTGDQDNFQKEKQQIKKQEFIDQLEEQ